MPSRVIYADRSSLVAVTGSTELGGGQDDHLPIGGPWNGYTFRGLVRFALDWTDVTRITRAELRLTTTTQVHVGFSSYPDIYVRRATTSWTPNGSGDGSWGTSPVVYPGPSSTTTGQVQKRMPTSESADVAFDITAIVKAWAPSSVEGGGGNPNYGIVMLGVASGDISEVYSFEASSGRPTIGLYFDSDTPPTAVATGPTGTQTTLRPTLTGTGSDPDGDAITSYQVEVRQGTTVVYTWTGGSGASYSHVPTSDLPKGSLTTRVRATAGGVQGAYSADKAFVVDRPPTMVAWSAPPASVTGTRRPVHTVTWQDLDADVADLYDINVYPGDGAGGMLPGSAAVYAKTNQTVGLTATTVSHTPAVDLPGGPLVARVRVRANGVWSSWSSWRAYTVVLTVPTLTWSFPEYDGGWTHIRQNELEDPARTLATQAIRACQFAWSPAAGQTITAINLTITVEDPGIGGPAVGTVVVNTNRPISETLYEYAFRPSSHAPAWYSGTVKCVVTITQSGGGQTIETRRSRFALGEWYGAVALGDSVTGLSVGETRKVDEVAVLYRAQTSPTAGVAGAVWDDAAGLAAIEAALPAANAYLGFWVRLGRRGDDGTLTRDPSFEDPAMPDWLQYGQPGSGSGSVARAGTPDGARCLQVVGGSAAPAYPGFYQRLACIPGAAYRVAGWMARPSGTGRFGSLWLTFRRADMSQASEASVTGATTGWTYYEAVATAPSDAVWVDVVCRINFSATVSADVPLYDDVRLYGQTAGDAGMDRLALAWTSLG